MNITSSQLSIINLVLQIDSEWKAKQFPLSELVLASDIFKEIKKNVKDDLLIDGDIELTSEQKVFITKLIDERSWTVTDAENIFEVKKMLK